MSALRLVIFDWDGTLMDSVARIVSSIQAAATELKLQVPQPEQVRDIIGLSLHSAMQRLFPQDSYWHPALTQAYRRHFVELSTIPMPLFAETGWMLDQLQQRQLLLAVATGKTRAGLDRALSSENLQSVFAATRCADESESKPSPLMLQQLLTELQLQPEQALMIGDSVYDIQMAVAAQVPALGVSWGVHAPHQLQQAGAQACLQSWPELLTWLAAR